MKTILLLGLLLGGNVCGAFEETAWAEGPTSPTRVHTGMQAVSAGDFERVVLADLTRRYGRPHHQMSFRVLFPNQLVEVPKGTSILRSENGQVAEGLVVGHFESVFL